MTPVRFPFKIVMAVIVLVSYVVKSLRSKHGGVPAMENKENEVHTFNYM